MTPHFDQLNEADKSALMAAVDTLCISNPDIAKQLQKLADIKTKTPIIFKMLILKLGV